MSLYQPSSFYSEDDPILIEIELTHEDSSSKEIMFAVGKFTPNCSTSSIIPYDYHLRTFSYVNVREESSNIIDHWISDSHSDPFYQPILMDHILGRVPATKINVENVIDYFKKVSKKRLPYT